MIDSTYKSLADKMVVFVFFGLGLLLVIRSREGGEDMDVNGGDGDNDCCGIFQICLKWRREKVYDGEVEWRNWGRAMPKFRLEVPCGHCAIWS